MSVYIIVDLECISGITNGAMIRTGSSEWASRGRHLATAEVNIVIEGALAAGAEKIYVRDSHDSGENLIREELHQAAELISGSAAVTPFLPGLNEAFDAVFLIGFHARMGTLHGHYDHTITTAAISEVRLNNIPIGEIGLYGAYAGLRNVPVTMVTGDIAAIHEARELFGDIQTVSVKEGYGRFAARVLSPEKTYPQIKLAAKKALETRGCPWRVDIPLHFAVDFLRSAEADMAEMVPGAERMSARTVEYQHDDPEMSFKALQAMIKLGGIAANRWAQALYTTGVRVN